MGARTHTKVTEAAIFIAETVGKLAKLSCQRTGDLAQLRMLSEALGSHCIPTLNNPEDLQDEVIPSPETMAALLQQVSALIFCKNKFSVCTNTSLQYLNS